MVLVVFTETRLWSKPDLWSSETSFSFYLCKFPLVPWNLSQQHRDGRWKSRGLGWLGQGGSGAALQGQNSQGSRWRSWLNRNKYKSKSKMMNQKPHRCCAEQFSQPRELWKLFPSQIKVCGNLHCSQVIFKVHISHLIKIPAVCTSHSWLLLELCSSSDSASELRSPLTLTFLGFCCFPDSCPVPHVVSLPCRMCFCSVCSVNGAGSTWKVWFGSLEQWQGISSLVPKSLRALPALCVLRFPVLPLPGWDQGSCSQDFGVLCLTPFVGFCGCFFQLCPTQGLDLPPTNPYLGF